MNCVETGSSSNLPFYLGRHIPLGPTLVQIGSQYRHFRSYFDPIGSASLISSSPAPTTCQGSLSALGFICINNVWVSPQTVTISSRPVPHPALFFSLLNIALTFPGAVLVNGSLIIGAVSSQVQGQLNILGNLSLSAGSSLTLSSSAAVVTVEGCAILDGVLVVNVTPIAGTTNLTVRSSIGPTPLSIYSKTVLSSHSYSWWNFHVGWASLPRCVVRRVIPAWLQPLRRATGTAV